MNKKEIRLLEKNENAILAQEAVFGWELQEKRPDKPLLFLRSNTYVLKREEGERSPYLEEQEGKWNRLFAEWNDGFLFRKWPLSFLFNLLAFLFLTAGIVFLAIASAMGEAEMIYLLVALLLILLALGISIGNAVMTGKQVRKINDLDAIARDVRSHLLLAAKKEEKPTE